MLTFTRRVGTAPGTTTMALRGAGAPLGIHQCWPPPVSNYAITTAMPNYSPSGIPPVTPSVTTFNPYASNEDMQGSQLGVILEPPEVNRTLPGGPNYYPYDPGYVTRGEDFHYHDSQFGEIPYDSDYGPSWCFTPVRSGWVTARDGQYLEPPPVMADRVTQLDGALAENTDAVQQLTIHQKRLFWLSVVSTFAIATVAAVNVYRLLKDKDR